MSVRGSAAAGSGTGEGGGGAQRRPLLVVTGRGAGLGRRPARRMRDGATAGEEGGDGSLRFALLLRLRVAGRWYGGVRMRSAAHGFVRGGCSTWSCGLCSPSFFQLVLSPSSLPSTWSLCYS